MIVRRIAQLIAGLAVLAELNQADLQALANLLKSGEVMPVIDRLYPLSEAAAR